MTVVSHTIDVEFMQSDTSYVGNGTLDRLVQFKLLTDIASS